MSTHKSENSAHEVGYIPPDSSERHRTLVLCFDGTGNKIDSNVHPPRFNLAHLILIFVKHTNVSQFFSMLRKDDCNQQMVYYQTGIGTYTRHKFGPITSVIAEVSSRRGILLICSILTLCRRSTRCLVEEFKTISKVSHFFP